MGNSHVSAHTDTGFGPVFGFTKLCNCGMQNWGIISFAPATADVSPQRCAAYGIIVIPLVNYHLPGY